MFGPELRQNALEERPRGLRRRVCGAEDVLPDRHSPVTEGCRLGLIALRVIEAGEGGEGGGDLGMLWAQDLLPHRQGALEELFSLGIGTLGIGEHGQAVEGHRMLRGVGGTLLGDGERGVAHRLGRGVVRPRERLPTRVIARGDIPWGGNCWRQEQDAAQEERGYVVHDGCLPSKPSSARRMRRGHAWSPWGVRRATRLREAAAQRPSPMGIHGGASSRRGACGRTVPEGLASRREGGRAPHRQTDCVQTPAASLLYARPGTCTAMPLWPG